jgi:hypothetical protein
MLIMAENMPDQYQEVVREMKTGGHLARGEQALGINHMEVVSTSHTPGDYRHHYSPDQVSSFPSRLACLGDIRY